ncbi:YjgN family protein [Leisingera sp. ANG-M1]|uniref:YjgN family protein n=1 Tax=Leisingera sp. ANG-M1 TaxID=1577895 RepID=UPI0006918A47|nr:YjgN family protein [Leisingera sp. ANG-M1]
MEKSATGFEFRGNAKEWFGIWIVNLLLSILTLGIYSAWAKVRRNKYFYNNTYIEGRNFDYHATGGQILIGRLIVVGAYIVLNVIIGLFPMSAVVVLPLLIVAIPWLIVRAMMFNARMSSFSNVRFNFTGGAGSAFVVFLIYPILTALTLYTTFPMLERAIKRFSINNHKLGTAPFVLDAPLKPFYTALFAALAWFLAVGAVLFVFAQDSVFQVMTNQNPDPEEVLIWIAGFYGVFFIGVLPAAVLYQALVRNAVYNHTVLAGGHRFRSNVSARALLWIAVTNLLAVALTLGLMLPWAQVRLARYLAGHTGVALGGSLDEFVGTQQTKTSALGDAYADIEGIDVGLPV